MADEEADNGEKEKEVALAVPPFFFLYKDGTVQRCPPGPLPALSPEPAGSDAVASRDVALEADLGLWARLFLPPLPSPPQKLPVVLYFHGGGFLFGGPAWNEFIWTNVAKLSASIWISVGYRLAPEHRLPAAFEDGFSALRWLHTQASLQIEGKESLMDDWLAHADFSRCFIAGSSAGANIAHHITMKAMNKPLSTAVWEPALHIEGLILIHPGFMRQNRTEEEMACTQQKTMDWELAEACLLVAGLAGPDIDHPYINPLSEFASMEHSFTLPRTLVALADMDGLHYMGLQYIQALKDAGCSVELVMSRGVGHGFFNLQPESENARTLFDKISDFISRTSA